MGGGGGVGPFVVVAAWGGVGVGVGRVGLGDEIRLMRRHQEAQSRRKPFVLIFMWMQAAAVLSL